MAEELPNEIWGEIFNYIPPVELLNNVSQVSTHFRNLTFGTAL